MPRSIHDLREAHAKEERALVRGALRRCGWVLSATAAELGVGTSTLQRLIGRHGLGDEYAARSPGRGRPRKAPR